MAVIHKIRHKVQILRTSSASFTYNFINPRGRIHAFSLFLSHYTLFSLAENNPHAYPPIQLSQGGTGGWGKQETKENRLRYYLFF